MNEPERDGALDAVCIDGDTKFVSSIPIGGTVRLFGDKLFVGVVTAVKFCLNCPALYCVARRVREVGDAWRD